MDTGTSGETNARLEPNRVLQELRAKRRWGRPRLARELHNYCATRNWASPGEQNIAKQIYRLESGRIKAPDEFYSRLYSEFFSKGTHELFGRTGAANPASGTRYLLRSHKFVPVYVGHSSIEQIVPRDECATPAGQWTDCRRRHVDSHTAIYGWPCGVVVLHVIEELMPERIAEVALWRRQTYPRNIDDAAKLIGTYGLAPLNDPYVLSAYWVERTPHDETRRDVALRLLSIPRVLTSRDDAHDSPDVQRAGAELIEATLLREGFDHPEICDFSIKGISTAYASWSGVVYHPTAPTRALAESDLIACELSIQAAWAYCDFIRVEVENGTDPVVPTEYGWRYLRGVKSRLTTERPQETSQHRSMREAIVKTSGLVGRLDQALEALKECGR